jgi:hypothetical protein
MIDKHGIDSVGAIIPMTAVAGTITRRAIEPMWLTATNYSVLIFSIIYFYIF